MLVVDRHALTAIDPLDLVDHVAVHGLTAGDAQDVLRIRGALGQEVARGDLLSVLHVETRGVLDLVGALLDLLHRDRELAAARDGQRARDGRRHVGLALRAALRLRDGLAGRDLVAVRDREHVSGGDADRDGVVL